MRSIQGAKGRRGASARPIQAAAGRDVFRGVIPSERSYLVLTIMSGEVKKEGSQGDKKSKTWHSNGNDETSEKERSQGGDTADSLLGEGNEGDDMPQSDVTRYGNNLHQAPSKR